MTKKLLAAALTAGILFAAPAFADRDDIEAAKAAKVSLTAAIAAAEKDTGGRAIEASLDGDGLVATYEISILKDDGKLWDVYVNATDGTILKKTEDMDD